MSPPASHRADTAALTAAATVRPVSIDEMSAVRHLHAAAVRNLAAAQLSSEEIADFVAHIYSDTYSGRLADCARNGRLLAVTLPDSPNLIATAAWLPANDAGASVRLVGVFTAPMFGGCGFGRLVAEAAQDAARHAGFTMFTARCPVAASRFFLNLGFEIASHGVWTITPRSTIQVAFMRKLVPAVGALPH